MMYVVVFGLVLQLLLGMGMVIGGIDTNKAIFTKLGLFLLACFLVAFISIHIMKAKGMLPW